MRINYSKQERIEEVYEEEMADSVDKKASGPRFLEKWLIIFDPWVTRSKDDPNKPFCKACLTSLDCNRAHLQRHERTTKHERNLKIFIENGEQAAIDNFNLRKERNKYYAQRKMKQLDKDNTIEFYSDADAEEYIIGEETEGEPTIELVKTNITRYNDQYTSEQTKQPTPKSKTSSNARNISKVISKKPPSIAASKKDRLKLFMQIQKDKSDLMKTFQNLVRTNNKVQVQGQPSPSPSATQEKNHVDLFFESVSSTVKTLSPKLIAEAKMRVQQLICELELRELTDSSSKNVKGNSSTSTIVVAPSSGNSFVLQTTEQTQ